MYICIYISSYYCCCSCAKIDVFAHKNKASKESSIWAIGEVRSEKKRKNELEEDFSALQAQKCVFVERQHCKFYDFFMR